MLLDEANNVIYTGGTLQDDEDDGSLMKWSSITAPSIAWSSDRNSLTEVAARAIVSYSGRKIVVASDGAIWMAASNGASRFDSSGVLQVNGSAFNERFVPLSSGAVAASSESGSNAVRAYDTSLTNTASYVPGTGGTTSVTDIVTLDASHIVVASGTTGTSARPLAVLDHSFNEVATYTAEQQLTCHRIANSGNTAFVSELDRAPIPDVPRVARYDLSGVTQVWTNTTMQATGSGYSVVAANLRSLIALDAEGYFYTVAEKASAVSKVQKRDPDDGSIIWETDIGDAKLENTRGLWVNSSAGIVVITGRYYMEPANGDPRHMVVLDSSDGSIAWTVRSGIITDANSGFFDAAIDSSGNVYAVGRCI